LTAGLRAPAQPRIVDGRHAPGGAFAGGVGLWVLEPRHLRVRGHRARRRVLALVRFRAHVLPQPTARFPQLPGALFDEGAVDVLRFFMRLKCRLMPCLHQKAVEARETSRFSEGPGLRLPGQAVHAGRGQMVAPAFSAARVGGRVAAELTPTLDHTVEVIG